MGRQKRPILEIVTSATRQVVKKFKTVTGNLSAPPLGLKEVARQWVATNYKVRAYHNGAAEAMLGVPMSAKSDLFENAFLDPTPTQHNWSELIVSGQS